MNLKATKQQRDFISNALRIECHKMNLTIDAICTLRDCWILLERSLSHLSYDARPAKFGTMRDWKLNGLSDKNIESVFRHILPKLS